LQNAEANLASSFLRRIPVNFSRSGEEKEPGQINAEG